MRILNAEPRGYSPEARKLLTAVGELDERELSRRELLEILPAYDVLIVRLQHQLDAEMITAASRLKVIATATTGLDHVDRSLAESKGITIVSLQGEAAFLKQIPASAEHTWALLMSLVRRIPHAFDDVRAGRWDRDAFRGHDLSGRRLGILGLGRNGRKVASYGHAFDMEIHAFDPEPLDPPAYVSLTASIEDLLPQADVLTVHAPLTPQTANLLGAEQFSLLPPGAVLVNTSRGELINASELLAALQSGVVAGAALDVLPGERQSHDSDFENLCRYARENQNLIITPHIGGATVESMAKTEIFIARRVADLLSGMETVELQKSDA